MKKNPFKVGDRVRYYTNDDSGLPIEGTGDVDQIDGNIIIINTDSDEPYAFLRAHYKQCKKLKRPEKFKRTVWVDLKTKEVLLSKPGSFNDGDYIQFIEVL